MKYLFNCLTLSKPQSCDENSSEQPAVIAAEDFDDFISD